MPPLIAEAHAERVATPIVEHVEQLVRETPVRALLVVVEVQRFGKDAEIVVDIVARAQIDLEARVDECRLGTERSRILILPELEQIFVAPRSEEHTSELQSLMRI